MINNKYMYNKFLLFFFLKFKNKNFELKSDNYKYNYVAVMKPTFFIKKFINYNSFKK